MVRIKTYTKMAEKELISDVRSKLSDILISISWREVARRYFGKSASWLYHKMDGIDGNGNPGGFTKEEAEELKKALYDVADRIKNAADKI